MSILTRMLLNEKLVVRRQLDIAIRSQVVFGGRLGTNLIELEYIDEQDFARVLAKKYGTDYVDLTSADIDPELLERVPRNYIEKYKAFPWRLRGRTLQLLMVNPSNRVAVAEISYATGLMIKPIVAPEYRMLILLEQHFGISSEWRFGTVRAVSGGGSETFEPPMTVPVPKRVLDFDAAIELLDAAEERDEIIEVMLDFYGAKFKRAVLMIVRNGYAIGLGGRGKGLDDALVHSILLPLDSPSAFKTTYEGRGHYLGKLAKEKANLFFLKSIGGGAPKNILLTPIVLGERVINIVYGDNGAGGSVGSEIDEILAVGRRASAAYERIIRKRIEQTIDKTC